MTEEDPRIIQLRKMRDKSLEGGGTERVARQRAKGKGTPRDRIASLLDPGTFSEIEPFITSHTDENSLPTEKFLGDGVVTGYGQIDGRTVYIYAQDFTVFGGTSPRCKATKFAA